MIHNTLDKKSFHNLLCMHYFFIFFVTFYAGLTTITQQSSIAFSSIPLNKQKETSINTVYVISLGINTHIKVLSGKIHIRKSVILTKQTIDIKETHLTNLVSELCCTSIYSTKLISYKSIKEKGSLVRRYLTFRAGISKLF